MAEKSVKQNTAKKTVSKSVATKKATVKKVAPKKVAAAPVIEAHECGCAHGCACHGHCGHHKCTFGRFVKKLIVFLVIFAMGFAAAKLCNMRHHPKMPRPEFENGCLVVKCPKMADKMATMDTNNDGCISHDEFRAARKMFRENRHAKPMPHAPEMPQDENVVTE